MTTAAATERERTDLAASVRRLLAERAGRERVRAVMAGPDGHDAPLWRQLAGTGLAGLAVPERFGGSDASVAELAVVLEELGAALACVPYLVSAAIAAPALVHAGGEAASRYLPGIADGSLVATVALDADGGVWRADRATATARPGDGGAWTVSGHHPYVVDGPVAGLVVAPASTPDGVALFAIDPAGPGATRRDLPTVDLTRRQSRFEWAGAPAMLLGSPGTGQGAALLDHVLDLAATALAAELVGTARQALEASVAYAKIRRQFGQPIGAFQAVKHRCADMLVAVESARACVSLAVAAASAGTADFPALASMAKACASDAAAYVTGENIQLHGAVGFTWEHDAHLLFKRASTGRLLFGDAEHHRDRLVHRAGLA